MHKRLFTLVSLLAACGLPALVTGCLDDSANGQPGGNGIANGDSGGPPGFIPDGSANAEGGVTVDAGIARQGFVPGFGSGGTVTRSAHFTLITRTGGEPGGAGVKQADGKTLVSGTAPTGK
jgi:hypothetical protein